MLEMAYLNITKTYENWIASDVREVCRIEKEVIEYLQGELGSIEEDSLFELKVILNELTVNAIRHGNRCNPLKYVKVTSGIGKDSFVYVIVEDEGEGYDYKSLISSHDKTFDDLVESFDFKENGRGIMIVKNLSNSIKFNVKGNKIIVLKKLNMVKM